LLLFNRQFSDPDCLIVDRYYTPLARSASLACTASFKRVAVIRGSAEDRRSVIKLGDR